MKRLDDDKRAMATKPKKGEMTMRRKALLAIAVLVLMCQSTVWAEQFMTLPFNDGSIALTQGWRYNAPLNPKNPEDPYKHEAIDWACPVGTPIFAVADGFACHWSQYDPETNYGYGEYVFIKHNNGYYTFYAHLQSVDSQIVQKRPSTDPSQWTPVVRGQQIGRSGMTGTTSYHLHFEVTTGGYVTGRVDPFDIYLTVDAYPPNGSMGSNHLWLSDPPSPPATLVGRYQDGTICFPILDCFNRHGGIKGVGWAISDNGNPIHVHYWTIPGQAPRYICQNVRNAKGEEGIIIFDSLFGSQAYLVSGNIWEFYRYGIDGRYGPDIPIGDGKTVSCPTSDYQNGIQCFENGYCKKGSVELHRLDGTLVYTFQPTGVFSALELTAWPVSPNHNTLEWLGGPSADLYKVLADGNEIGQTTLKEFTEAGLQPGTTHRYQVIAWSNISGGLDRSNEVTVVGPGQAGSFVLQGAPDGHQAAYLKWSDTQYQAPFYWVFRDGVKIAKSASDAKTDRPLEPSHNYTYQVAAITASELILGWSNPVTVITDPAPELPPLPDPVPSSVQIHLPQTTWEFGTDGYVTATVYDQYGAEISGIRVLFLSSDNQKFAVSADSGYCLAHGLGTAEVWAELYDARWIQSEKVMVSVVETLPPDPDVYPSAPLQLEKKLEITNPKPYIEFRNFSTIVSLSNPTEVPITFYGPSIFNYNTVDGRVVDFSGYPSTPKTLQPEESWEGTVSGGSYFSSAGSYFICAQIRLEGEGINNWYVIDQGTDGISTKLYYQVISESDLKAELEFFSFRSLADEFFAGDQVKVRVIITNSGDIAISQPFTLLAGVAGWNTLDAEVPSLERGMIFSCDFDFGQLPIGSYKIDAFIDSANVVPEYNEGNNIESMIVEVRQPPALPDLLPSVLMVMTQNPNSETPIKLALGVNNEGDSLAQASTLTVQDDISGQSLSLAVPEIVGFDLWTGQITIGPLSVGWHNLLVKVDAENVLMELNEDNNTTATQIFVAEPPKPDLTVTQFAPTKTQFSTTERPQVKVSVTNRDKGNATTCRFTLRLTQGNPLATVNIPALAAGQSYGFTITLNPLSAGDWPIVGTVDSAMVVAESNETNNSATSYIRVVKSSSLPDLTVDKTYYLFYDWGDCYLFMFKIINIGYATAGNFRVEGEIPEMGLTFYRDVPAGLARGSYSLFLFYPVYPVPPVSSTLTLRIKVDSLNQVAESNESNNSYERVEVF